MAVNTDGTEVLAGWLLRVEIGFRLTETDNGGEDGD